jgi:hypothetical protein
LIDPVLEEDWIKLQTKYGIELPTSVKIIRLNQLKIWAKIKHINSLLAKRRMIGYFRKNMSKIPVDNGSSLNKLITLKIIALTNITLIETSVLVVYP